MKHYSNEYKQEALELAKEIGVRAAGERLGINDKTLYRWRTAAKEPRNTGASSEEQKQMRALQKEVDELRRANEILKKAMGFLVR